MKRTGGGWALGIMASKWRLLQTTIEIVNPDEGDKILKNVFDCCTILWSIKNGKVQLHSPNVQTGYRYFSRGVRAAYGVKTLGNDQ